MFLTYIEWCHIIRKGIRPGKCYGKKSAIMCKHFNDLADMNIFKVEGKLLDVGCREGDLYEHIINAEISGKKRFPFVEYTGIDIVQHHVDTARSKNIPCQLMDLCNLEIKDDTFDIVFSHHSLEHVWDADLACAEIHRVLKIGGIFLFIVPLGEKNLSGDIFGCIKNIGFELLYGVIRKRSEAWGIAKKG